MVATVPASATNRLELNPIPAEERMGTALGSPIRPEWALADPTVYCGLNRGVQV